jgi:hypothetical protein
VVSRSAASDYEEWRKSKAAGLANFRTRWTAAVMNGREPGPAGKVHADELDSDTQLVGQLVAEHSTAYRHRRPSLMTLAGSWREDSGLTCRPV